MYKPHRVWNRFFVFAWIVAVTLHIGQNVFNSTMTVFSGSFGYSNTFAGSLAIPYLAGAMIGRVAGGWLSDKISRRLGMVIGTGCFLIASAAFCLPFASGAAAMMALRFIHGFGYACGTTSYLVVTVDVVPADKISIGLGINCTGQGIAFALNGFLIAALTGGGTYTLLFAVSAGFVAVSVLFSCFEKYEKHGVKHRTESGKKTGFIEKTALPYALIILFYYCAVSLPLFYLVPLTLFKQFENWSALYSFCAAGMAAGNLLTPKIAQRCGSLAGMLPVYLSGFIGFFIFLFTGSQAIFITSGFLYGVSMAGIPVMQEAAVRGLPAEKRGSATAAVYLATDLAMGFGPVIWGALIDGLGFSVPFAAGAMLFMLSLLVHIFIMLQQKKTGEARSADPECTL